ncbi:DNA-(apurinic or apyrimidinic site) lyase [Armadillidium nasatum]|uniref:exodeoxyribonuclease III n=1 Tax=Armadillidium nasatum TaxID=96803 RepID=A0A5N5TAS1_9CRUS|nr:DNA-(apurinic or apyrimidinic site) lyase [Armadillidium nasatum]
MMKHFISILVANRRLVNFSQITYKTNLLDFVAHNFNKELEFMAPKRKLNKSDSKSAAKETSKKAKSSQEEKDSQGKTESKESNFKIISWNVSGVRAWVKKDGLSIFNEDPDILCLQEIKCSEKKFPEEFNKYKTKYFSYIYSAQKEGYSGVALFTKKKPLSVKKGIDSPTHDDEGRIITAEYEKFYLVAAYVPNAGRGLVTLDKRMDWDSLLQDYLKKLDEKKPVIYCGDLNVSHQEIDLANPKSNTRNAGFTKEEREGFTNLLNEGFVDSFRELYPEKKGQYTFWSYMGNARAKNVGWRLDYFVLSERLRPNLRDNIIHNSVMGSDHCPISLLIEEP